MTEYKIIDRGQYTGNGSSQSISIGWRPSLVITGKEINTGPNARKGVGIKLGTMSSDETMFIGASPILEIVNNSITINDDGFTVGSEDRVNRSNQDVSWIALRSGVFTSESIYTGAHPTKVTIEEREDTAFMVVVDETDTSLMIKTQALSNANGGWFYYHTTSANFNASVGIEGTSSSGTPVELGDVVASGTIANKNGNSYHSFISKEIAGYWYNYSPSSLALSGIDLGGSQFGFSDYYVGNGATSPQTISLGWQPKAILTISNTALGFKVDTMAGASCIITGDSSYFYGNGMTITSDGFEVDHADLQPNGSATYYFAWR